MLIMTGKAEQLNVIECKSGNSLGRLGASMPPPSGSAILGHILSIAT